MSNKSEAIKEEEMICDDRKEIESVKTAYKMFLKNLAGNIKLNDEAKIEEDVSMVISEVLKLKDAINFDEIK